jgi:hypothetical protein
MNGIKRMAMWAIAAAVLGLELDAGGDRDAEGGQRRRGFPATRSRRRTWTFPEALSFREGRRDSTPSSPPRVRSRVGPRGEHQERRSPWENRATCGYLRNPVKGLSVTARLSVGLCLQHWLWDDS